MMKTIVKNLTMILAAAATFTACSNTDLYDPAGVELQTKQSYQENFSKKYAGVNLNQSWDYSTKQSAYSLPVKSNKARTRASEGSWSKEDYWYEVDNSTLNWMHEQLVEGEDHRDLGKLFYMTVPGNDFYIVPIYQGVASAVWEFHVVIGSDDYLIWGKSEEIEIKDVRNQEWHGVVQPTYEWGGDGQWWESLFNTDGNDKWTWIPTEGGVRNTVTNVRAIPRKFSNFPVGEDMYFYLKVTQGDAGNCETGTEQSSLNGQMLHLDCPRPTNIPAEYETMIIGCEDANLENADYDMNDLVLLVYGPQMPKPIEITEGDPVVSTKTVRYMIEDLGDTDDFDFNDVVIDMLDITEKTPVYTNGKLTSWNEVSHRQQAIIRHLGGVLPFTLTVGDTTLPELGGQSTFQTSPDQKFDVSGWNIDQHNISVQVRQKSNSTVYYHVTFPRAGEAPMIIAVDPTQTWMPERHSVPSTWFYIPE